MFSGAVFSIGVTFTIFLFCTVTDLISKLHIIINSSEVSYLSFIRTQKYKYHLMLGIYISIWSTDFSRTSCAETSIWKTFFCVLHRVCIVHPQRIWAPTVHTSFLLYVIWDCFYSLSSNQLHKNIEQFTVMFLNYLFWVVMHLIYCSKNCQSSLLWFCIYLSQTLFFTYSSSVDGFSFLFSIRFCPVCLSSQILLIFSHTYLVPLFESRQWISCLFLLQV